MDIILGRGNANKVLVRLLHHLMETHQIRLASAEGGDLRNAIPREADAIIAYESAKKAQIEEAVACYGESHTR